MQKYGYTKIQKYLLLQLLARRLFAFPARVRGPEDPVSTLSWRLNERRLRLRLLSLWQQGRVALKFD